MRIALRQVDGLEQVEGLRNVKLPGVTSQSKFKGKGKAVDQELGDEEWEGDVVQLHGSTSSVRCSACSWVGKWLSKHTRAFAKGETLDCPACAETSEPTFALPCCSR